MKGGKVTVKGTEVSGNTIVMVDKLKEIPPIPDEPKDSINKNNSLPKTGDGSNPSLYAGIMALAGGALILLGFKRRIEDEGQ